MWLEYKEQLESQDILYRLWDIMEKMWEKDFFVEEATVIPNEIIVNWTNKNNEKVTKIIDLRINWLKDLKVEDEADYNDIFASYIATWELRNLTEDDINNLEKLKLNNWKNFLEEWLKSNNRYEVQGELGKETLYSIFNKLLETSWTEFTNRAIFRQMLLKWTEAWFINNLLLKWNIIEMDGWDNNHLTLTIWDITYEFNSSSKIIFKWEEIFQIK